MKHIGEFDRRPVILLGYNKDHKKIMILDPLSMEPFDRDWIGKIIESGYAQQRNYLYNALYRENHPLSNQDGWSYVTQHCRFSNVPFFEVKLQDQAQSVAWIETPSNYDPKAGQGLFNEQQAIPPEQKPDVIPEAVTQLPDVSKIEVYQPATYMEDHYVPSASPSVSEDDFNDLKAEVKGIHKTLESLDKALRTLNRELSRSNKKSNDKAA